MGRPSTQASFSRVLALSFKFLEQPLGHPSPLKRIRIRILQREPAATLAKRFAKRLVPSRS